ncbi:LLM class flavin-dependent oxidoreductase [Agrococcus sediminis]|uniref:LLM class flavin-dependent oxidoreductase n=1 Tax=Agrococcus sediminis TaxID=2599924 RepID=A0A5M8Q8R9_9MICO|nr:LLM class flavin-dependent oxidoreductase [Agrococcus sediminis]KAA6431334.1 LLM class flavin-dependent oxidoreductase [Agrococcus sediminis]
MRLSVLDLAPIHPGETAGESLAGSVRLAQAAERLGYRRVWYAEHHNMATIASSATSVLIAHVAAHTRTIRLGAGGVMLPNHSPLVIAEQFGTLAELHPGRIDLGLGRAPGTDQRTWAALRRDIRASERFPEDVVELQGYLRGEPTVPGIRAVPGHGTDVPLTILGSSLFGAQLAAALGLPYAFASHFAPDALQQAVAVYRERFEPSRQLAEPFVIAGINAVVAPTRDEAMQMQRTVVRSRVRSLLLRDGPVAQQVGDDELDALAASPQAAHIASMVRHTALGTGDEAVATLRRFAVEADADELIMAVHGATDERVRALELLGAAGALGEAPAA